MIGDYGITINRKTEGQGSLLFHDGDVPYFSFPNLDRLGLRNGFSTRLGGVSTGFLSSMNLSFGSVMPDGSLREKEPAENVRENYRRMCRSLGMNVKRVVLSYQTHTTNIRTVTEEDAGKGPFFKRDYTDVDGLITNVPDMPLVTLYADCVPLYFADPVRKCIGLSHAGWRGTVNRMACVTVSKLHETFGSRPEDLYAAIGPSICRDCYEVGEEVASEFEDVFGNKSKKILTEKENGKYLLDLWESNRIMMLRAGIPEDHIVVTDVCTRCNPELLYSHRVSGNNRGLLGAFLSL